MEKTQVATLGKPDLDPNAQKEMEGNAKLREWFTKHPDEKSTLELTLEEKKQFILTYYSEDINADELLEKMLEDAEKIQDEEIQKGNTKPPFTPELVYSTIAIARAKVVDELIEEVSKYYEERRKLIKGKEINDPGVIKVTQLNCSKMATSLQEKILKQVEEEAKSRKFPFNEFMESCAMAAMSDVQSFAEIERIFTFRKAEENKDKPFDKAGVTKYIDESLVITKMIDEGKLDGSLVFVYPHLLSDKLFNLTGYESEEVVHQIRKVVKDDTIDEDLVNLIVKEAYAVEKCRDSCQSNFDNQMMDYESQMSSAYQQRMHDLQNIKDPLEDPAIKKLIEMGMMSKEDAENLIKMGQMMESGGMPPGMMPPGMMPGMMPPGMMPPGMMQGMPGMPGMPPGMMPSPEQMMEMMQMMPPELMMQMMPPGMFGPGSGMFPPVEKSGKPAKK